MSIHSVKGSGLYVYSIGIYYSGCSTCYCGAVVSIMIYINYDKAVHAKTMTASNILMLMIETEAFMIRCDHIV